MSRPTQEPPTISTSYREITAPMPLADPRSLKIAMLIYGSFGLLACGASIWIDGFYGLAVFPLAMLFGVSWAGLEPWYWFKPFLAAGRRR